IGIPGLIVAAPSDALTAKGLLKSAIRSNNPVLFFEHKLLYAMTSEIPNDDFTVPLGKARVARSGSDVTIVTWLLGVSIALEAAALLSQKGIEAEIIDLCTLYPIDFDTVIESVSRTGSLVTLEEGNTMGGIGSEIIASAALMGPGIFKTAPVRLGAPECPVPYAKGLEEMMLVQPEMVVSAVEKQLG
ncbi:MAG: pyruvate dehydrogenase complex E1 component subunit beta, partial [bacterium]|nr:pyruvate dehydrogenase complex E1 component subunit beta [bacterium]